MNVGSCQKAKQFQGQAEPSPKKRNDATKSGSYVSMSSTAMLAVVKATLLADRNFIYTSLLHNINPFPGLLKMRIDGSRARVREPGSILIFSNFYCNCVKCSPFITKF